MGMQIAARSSLAGQPTELLIHLEDESKEEETLANLKQKLERLVKRIARSRPELIHPEKTDITFATNLLEINRAPSLVVEAISEDFTAKQELHKLLDQHLPPKTPIFSNTSSLSVSDFVPGSPRCLYGFMHFFNPIDMIPYAEYGVSEKHGEDSHLLEVASQFLSSLNINGIRVVENPGFVGNRLLFALLREAVFIEKNGFASAEEIDLISTKVLGLPTPVSKLKKIVGHDLCAKIIENIFSTAND